MVYKGVEAFLFLEIHQKDRQEKEYIVDGTSEIAKNVLLIYPSIVCNKISHGKVTELLGIKKIELIQLYGRLGIPYLDMSDEEFDEEMETVRRFRKLPVYFK